MAISRREMLGGVLRAFRGVEPEPERESGLPRVDPAACYAGQGNICEVCIERCPLRPKAIRYARGTAAEVIEERCDGCGICVDLCPADAIR